jgi:hypothetical protein
MLGNGVTVRHLSAPVLVAVLAVSACATGYHPAGLMGGYSEMRINERTFEVQFEGNGFTSRQLARRGVLHRAAELTIDSGYFGFWVGDDDSTMQVNTYTTPTKCRTKGDLHGGTYDGTTSCEGGDTKEVRKPRASITIIMVTYPEAQNAPPGKVVYDARLLLRQAATLD